MSFNVRPYCQTLRADWSTLLANSRNGTFLFERDYMEYHADRFKDASCIVYDGDHPAAIFVASMHDEGRTILAHGGLTFGGLVVGRNVRSEQVMDIVDHLLRYFLDIGVMSVEVKPVPPMFCAAPSDDVLFALARRNFHVTSLDLSSAIDLLAPISPTKSRQRDIARASKLGIHVERASVGDIFPLIEEVLSERHATAPVHNLSEIERLSRAFPDRIFALGARLGSDLVAGAIIYAYDRVWHTQYLASTSAGRTVSALDPVIATAIEEAIQSGNRWFSFGSSMDGNEVNTGLLWQKESFGGRGVIFPRLRGNITLTT